MGNRSPGRGCWRRGGGGGGQRAARRRNLEQGFIVAANVETLRADDWDSEQKIRSVVKNTDKWNAHPVPLKKSQDMFAFKLEPVWSCLYQNSWIPTGPMRPYKYTIFNAHRSNLRRLDCNRARDFKLDCFPQFSYFTLDYLITSRVRV